MSSPKGWAAGSVMLAACCGGGVLLLVLCAAFFEAREVLVPWYARQASELASGRPLAMAVAGWAVWATALVLATAATLRPWWFAAPAVVACLFALMFMDIRHRGGTHEPWMADLLASIPGGGAFRSGTVRGGWGAFLTLLVWLIAHTGVTKARPSRVWLWQLVRLGAPLTMLPALAWALVAR